jgi:DNA-binding winged helix-turn-helix (wHTH) protein/tetratricopeptide (TPR) repeat protein/TolB-like protein
MTLATEFQLGDWIVQPSTNTLVGPDGEARVEPKAMQVLTLLAGRAGDVVSKKEILTDVWEGTYVSEEVLPNAIWELRKALRDDAKRPRFIQTLPKRGYRLIAPVSPSPSTSAAGDDEREALAAASLPDPRWKWVVAAAALATGIVIGGVVLRARTATPIARPGDAYSVMVAGFDNHATAESVRWLATGVPTMLRTGLAELPGVHVVSDDETGTGTGTGTGSTGTSASGNDQAVARRVGARALLRGSIFQQGSDYRIDVQVEDVATSRIVAAHSVRGNDVFLLTDELTLWVRDSLNPEAGRSEDPVPPLREMTTTSLDAFRLYNEGVEARRHLRLGDARKLLSEAVAIDPGFALAYFELQWVALWSKDEAAYVEFHEKTLAHQERLPPQKRMLLEAIEVSKTDAKRAEAMLEDVVARLPDEEEAYMHLFHLYRSTYQTEESLKTLERGISAVPHSGYLRLNYGYGLLWEGRYPEAIHQFEVYSRINPDEANPWDSLGEAYLIAGIPDRALEKYARALEVDPAFSSSNLGRAWAFGELGRFDEALNELQSIRGELPPGFSANELAFFRAYLLSRAGRYQAVDAIVSGLAPPAPTRASEKGAGPGSSFAVAVALFQSLVDIERGRPREAEARIRDVVRALPVGPLPERQGPAREIVSLSRLLGGVAACRSGELDEAKRYLAELGEVYEPRDPRQNWWYHLLLGEVALASGEADAAYSAFTQGEPDRKLMFSVNRMFESLGGSLIFRDGAARAKALAGDRRAAVELYQELLRPDIGQKWTAVLEPRFELALARLERDGGESKAASRHYRAFLELWAGADRGLPEVEEAKSYLASKS